MTRHQRAALHQLLRDSPLDLGGDLAVQRPLFEQLLTGHGTPPGVTTSPGRLGDVPVTWVDVAGTRSGDVLLFLHGGGYALGSAAGAVGLAAGLAGRAAARAVAVDYRLAPEHPFPAALEDALAAYRALLDGGADPRRLAVAGESAGGGLAVAVLTAARAAGLPQPACAVALSPWADLTVSGGSAVSRAGADPVLTAGALRRRAADYAAGADPADPRLSPVGADLTGLPPLLVQVGSHEVLLDDALRLAARAAHDDVAVTLDVVPGVPHVFQAFAEVLDEGGAALDRAAVFLRAHLGG